MPGPSGPRFQPRFDTPTGGPPTSGAWQTDAELQRLFKAALQEIASSDDPRYQGSSGREAANAYARYLDANRERLGIPPGTGPDPATGGQTLRVNYKWSGPIARTALMAGGMLLGGQGIPALIGAGGPAAVAADGTLASSAAVPTSVASTAVPAAIGSQGASAGIPLAAAAPLASSSIPIADAMQGPPTVTPNNPSADVPLGGVTPGSGGESAIDKIRKALTSQEGIASLATLIPALIAAKGGGNTNGTTDELRRMQGITEAQMRRADPLHQVAVQLAYGRAPISARNGISLQNIQLPPQG